MLARGRGRAAVVMAALAFSFKLQAVFFLPVGLVALLQKKLKWHDLLWFPATFTLTALPAIALGKPPLDTLMIYINQTTMYSWRLNWSAPSLFSLTGGLPLEAGFWLGLTAAVVCVVILTICAVRYKFPLLPVAAAFCIFIPFMLPAMHDRYFFLADVLCAGLTYCAPGWRSPCRAATGLRGPPRPSCS